MLLLCILLTKSENNKKCADWAKSAEMYDIAISRLYYSLYQKMLIKCEGLVNTGASSHEKTIAKYFENTDNEKSRVYCGQMQGFRRIRNKADYNKENIKVQEYNQYERIYKQIDEYIECN